MLDSAEKLVHTKKVVSYTLMFTLGSDWFLIEQPALQGEAYVNPSAPHTGSYWEVLQLH